jgi:NTE family protein
MKVKDAVRISMTIPLYFEAVFIDQEGNVIDHPKNKTGLDIMSDGGLTANFPIRMFDSTKYTDTTKPNQFSINRQTIGFRIDRDEQIRNDADGKGLAEMPISNISDYFGAFYNIVLENLNRQTLTHDDWLRTISISDGNISARIRRLPASDVKLLVENGSSATRRYLSNQLSLRR